MKNLDSVLEGRKSVAIAGHVRPDGDCVGSCLSVYNYIKTYFKDMEVYVFLEQIPNIFKFLKGADEIVHEYTMDKQFDLFIALDCGDSDRLGGAYKYFENAKNTICIDHHISNQSFADDNYIVGSASSTCELVFDLIDAERITKEIAECLYTGMVHDTGVFQYSCTSAKTMNAAGVLMEKGIDYPKIVSDTFYTKTYNQNRIMGKALLDSKLYLDGKVILSAITAAEMKEFDVLPKHLDGIVSQLRSTKDVEVAVFIYETETGDYKVSTRVNGDFNASELAVHYGGGGHVKAAGFTMHGTLEEIISDVISEIGKRM